MHSDKSTFSDRRLWAYLDGEASADERAAIEAAAAENAALAAQLAEMRILKDEVLAGAPSRRPISRIAWSRWRKNMPHRFSICARRTGCCGARSSPRRFSRPWAWVCSPPESSRNCWSRRPFRHHLPIRGASDDE